MPDIDIAHLVDRFMRRIHASLNAKAHEFDTYKLGPAGGILLLTVAESEPVAIHDLVTQMARDKSQITRAIKSLETKALVVRKEDPADGRVSMISLTELGRDAVIELQQAVAGVLGDILSPLSSAEQDRFREMLRRLN